MDDEEIQGKYDTSQYDEHVKKDQQLPPKDGAHLIMRTDDDVDYNQAWDVLRDMMSDDDYKRAVMSFIVRE
jgi:hypothetical protein